MGKKPKKSKAELEEERLAAEEEARKQKIIDDKRRAEEEERSRLEALRIAAERKAYREAEVERLASENAAVKELLSDRLNQMRAEEQAERESLEWARFREPTEAVNARNPRDLNTFLTLTAETVANSMSNAMSVAQEVVQVAKEVDDMWSDCVGERNDAGRELAASNVSTCCKLVREKINQATAELLKYADEKLNDKSELLVESSADGVTVGVWGSYAVMRPIRKSVQFEDIGVQIDIPKQILAQDTWFVHRITRLSVDSTSYAAYADNGGGASGKYLVGDLIFIDILRPPPQVQGIRAKKYTVRNVSSASLSVQECAYPSSVGCRVFIKIPDDIVMSDDMTIAVWDDEAGDWVDNGISDYQYTDANRTCQFYLTTVGTFGLVKDRCADLPYKKWTVSPVRDLGSEFYERYARVTVQTQRLELAIDVVGHEVRLLRPSTKQFKDLIGVLMSPSQLLRRLQRRGVNIMPANRDCMKCADAAEYQLKSAKLESAVYDDMSRWISSYDYQSCPEWARALDESKAGVLLRESSCYTGGIDSFDFDCVLAELDEFSESSTNSPGTGCIEDPGVKYTLVAGNEYGSKKAFSNDPRPCEVAHMTMQEAMTSRQTIEAGERAKGTNGRFQKTIFTLLCGLRLLNAT